MDAAGYTTLTRQAGLMRESRWWLTTLPISQPVAFVGKVLFLQST